MICEAICRGVAQQQKHDQSNIVSTVKTTKMGFKRFVGHECDLQASSRNAVEHILSTTMQDGTHRPTGEYPVIGLAIGTKRTAEMTVAEQGHRVESPS